MSFRVVYAVSLLLHESKHFIKREKIIILPMYISMSLSHLEDFVAVLSLLLRKQIILEMVQRRVSRMIKGLE